MNNNMGVKMEDKKEDKKIQIFKVLSQDKDMPSTISVSSIAIKTGASIGEVRVALNQLEVEGLVKSRADYFYLTREGLRKAIDLKKE